MTTVGHPPRLLHGYAATNERLVREAIARNVIITQGKTRLDVKCSK
jgi:hypothetical protein